MRILALILLPALLLSAASTAALAQGPVAVLGPPVAAPEAQDRHAPLLRPSAQALDFALPNGRFFKQDNGQGGALRLFEAGARDGSPTPDCIVSIALTLAP